MLACAAGMGCVSPSPRPAPPATPPADASPAAAAPANSNQTADTLRRLTLFRPLESGIDTPLLGIQIHGYLMVDGATYSSSALGETQLTLRRADINYQRMLWGHWLLYADTQLVDKHFEFKDVYLRKQTHYFGVVTIGNQQEPFGLEQFGSFRNTTFLERSTSSALAPSRSIGISSSDFRGPWIWSYGFFTVGAKDETRQQRGLALTGRLAYVLKTDSGMYHLAADYSTRRYAPNTDQSFSSAPEVALSSNDKFLNTHKIPDASQLQRYGLEAAHVDGPFSWQAEYMEAHLQRNEGLPPLHFRGWYAYASWMLTGENRDYRESNATFGKVVPHAAWNGHGGGALEVAVRLSQTDLNDRDILGGKETNLTLGVNWYLDKAVRLSANLVHAIELDKPGHAYDGKHPSALVGRLQYEF